MEYLRKFLYVFSGGKKRLIFLILIFILISSLEAFGISLIGGFLNIASESNLIFSNKILMYLYNVSNFKDVEKFVLFLGLLIVGIFILKSMVFILGKLYVFRTLYIQQAIIQKRLFHAYLFAPYEFHLSNNTAQFINNVGVESQRFTVSVATPLAEFCSHGIVVVALTFLLAITDKVLLLLSLGLIVPVLLIFFLLSKKLKVWGQLAGVARENTIKVINHGLGGLKETRIIGCESYFEAGLNKQVRQQARVETFFKASQFIPKTLIETLLVVFIVGFICLSQFLLGQNFQDTVSSIGIFAIAAFRLVPAVNGVSNSMGRLRNSMYTLEILYFDLKQIEKLSSNHSKRIVSSALNFSSKALTFQNRLEICDIVYRYPTAEVPSLNHISMGIERGESIGLIGESGAGKTTLVDVILSLLIPEAGDILLDGQSIYKDLAAWKNLIGYIPQSIFLLDDTVKRNIAFGVDDADINEDRLYYAIKAAQLEKLVRDLPNEVDTSVGERGVRLSGGQRQRIGIARALYHQREILVLDEATSALDNETEKLVNDSIKALAGTKTLIIIAHRLTTLKECDRIYMLSRGEILRSGNYKDVVTI